MVIKGITKTGEYFDSVSLMIVSKKLNELKGIKDSSVVMGTAENKAILNSANFLLPEFKECDDTDLLIVVEAESEEIANSVLEDIDTHLKSLKVEEDTSDFTPKSLEGAIKNLPGANLSLISVAGKYAGAEAKKALDNNMHVMLFSDNISIETEVELKKIGKEKGLLVMGPDCGTAIINGVPLAFANVVNRGDIGVVAAAGTGLQEVTTLISNMGGGISQAIGTGGRDIKKEVGGIMMIEGIKALANDEATKVILLVSKPPHPEVLAKIQEVLKSVKKPVVSVFLGAEKIDGIQCEETLEAGAMATLKLSGGKLPSLKRDLTPLAEKEAGKLSQGQKYLRALYSGGTYCSETKIILEKSHKDILSNSELKDIFKSEKNTVVDLGEDEFTAGRPHPMIDYSIRCKRLIEESKDPEVAVVLLDIVLGYGSNMDPAGEIIPAIEEVKKASNHIPIICHVAGTNQDPQSREITVKKLLDAGAIVVNSNAEMATLGSEILKRAEA